MEAVVDATVGRVGAIHVLDNNVGIAVVVVGGGELPEASVGDWSGSLNA